MKQIFVHLDRCTGCHSCEVACAVEHSQLKGLSALLFEIPRPRPRLRIDLSQGEAVPLLCRHCEDAPCLNACITGAIYRDPAREGLVLQNPNKCIGCWTCIMVCPFGVIGQQTDGRRVALKCDRCPGRATPACVESCTTKALEYQDVETFARARRKQAAGVIVEAEE